MKAIINPGKISGHVIPPPSKSIMQRICAAALLRKGVTVVHNPGAAGDDKAALRVIQQLGADVLYKDGHIEITSRGIEPSGSVIDCGESGLSARLFTPVAAICDRELTITGQGSLLQRPMQELGSILAQLDVTVKQFNGLLPITLKGPLKAKTVKVDGRLSSQYLSGLLFALGYAAADTLDIAVKSASSRPYIDLTLNVLTYFGYEVSHERYELFRIGPSRARSREPIEYTVETDWSSAAIWLVAAAVSGSVSIGRLDRSSLQADRNILEVLEQCGAVYHWQGDTLQLAAPDSLAPFHADATDCPDLFPVLSVLAACCEGESSIRGLHRLPAKESNREQSICDMLTGFGIAWRTGHDTLIITGRKQVHAAAISSHNDHRIAMAAAVGALRADGVVSVEGAEAVSKSYPQFFHDLRSLGVDYTLTS